MKPEENVISYYILCNKLKNVIRNGWLSWNVQRDRLESVAEHVYGAQQLALIMYSEYKYDIDIKKVLCMIAVHEIGEISIGDINQFQMSKDEKEKKEHEAVHNMLSGLLKGEEIENLFLEFDGHKTKESMFAYMCDKLECDLQCKIYGEEGCVDLSNQGNNKIMDNDLVKKLLDEGYTWEEMWIKFGQEIYPYDDNFLKVSNYALTHKITDKN